MIFKDFLPYDLTNLLIFGLMIFAGMMVQVKREKRRPHFHIRMVITLLIMVADAVIFAILQPQYFDEMLGMSIVTTATLIGHFLALTHSRLSNITMFVLAGVTLALTIFNLWLD